MSSTRPLFFKRPSTLGLQARLSWFAVALVVPFVVFMGFSAVQSYRLEQQHTRTEVLARAQLSATRLEDRLSSIRLLLVTLGESIAPVLHHPRRLHALLQRLSPEVSAELSNLSVWDVQGNNLGSLHPEVARAVGSIAERPYFREVMHTGRPVVAAPVPSRVTGGQLAIVAAPVLQDDRVVGVLVLSIRLEQMQALLNPSPDADGSVTLVLDAQGTVLMHSLDAQRWVGKRVISDSATLAELRQSRPALLEHIEIDGVSRLFGHAPTRMAAWTVLVGVSDEQATAPARARLRRNLLLISCGLTAGLLLAAWAARGIARPLRALGHDARRLARGELAHRYRTDGMPEVAQLAGALNQAAESLQQRTLALQQSRALLRKVTDHLPALVSLIDRDARYCFANQAYQDWLGVDPEQLIGTPLRQLYGDEVYEQVMEPASLDAWAGRRQVFERTMATLAGERWVQVTIVPSYDTLGMEPDRVQWVCVMVLDVTERHLAQERLRRLAEFDTLTGLPNRSQFMDRLAQASQRAQRQQQSMAVMFIDIDHFKQVNDQRGHAAGDELLRTVAQRLAAGLRDGDTVARLAGDEFTVILEDVQDAANARTVAQGLVEAARAPLSAGGASLRVSLSVGVVVWTGGPLDGSELLRRADAALYEAKHRGRDRCWVVMANGAQVETQSPLLVTD